MMKKTVIRFGWSFLLLVMTFGNVLAQEGEAAETASNESSPALMIGILILGVVVIIGLGLAISSQQSAENNGN
jgi:hypothetical protein